MLTDLKLLAALVLVPTIVASQTAPARPVMSNVAQMVIGATRAAAQF